MQRYKSLHKRELLETSIKEREIAAQGVDIPDGSGFVKSGSVAAERVQDINAYNNQLARDKQRLAAATPPEIRELEDKGISHKALVARKQQLEQFIVHEAGQFPRMLSHEELHKAPSGSTDMELLFNRKVCHHNVHPETGNVYQVTDLKRQQSAYEEHKDLCRILNRDHEANMPNVASLEMLRPGRVNANNSAMDYVRKVYSAPRVSAQQFEETIGVDQLGPIARMIHEAEKAGETNIPTPEEMWKRLYSKDREIVPSFDPEAPRAMKGGWYEFPDGTKLRGTRESVMAQYQELQLQSQ